VIVWDAVVVEFDGTRVLGPISLRIGEGEWVGIIGPNGAGKSTLLKTVLGAVGYSGALALNGGTRRPGLDLAWMPQRPHMPDEMGLADYVMLGRTPHLGYVGGEGRHDVESVDRALARLDLTALARRRLGTLSGGEAQRAVLARALAQEAPVLLLDEPTASLDVGHAIDVLEVVDDLRRTENLTIVTAVHDLTLAGRFAERLVLLADGTVQADGSPTEVLTEGSLTAHYGVGIRVVPDEDGPMVIPTRRSDDR
jgi:iron complex transport system ATP-binding protein